MYIEGENRIEKSATQDNTTTTVTVVEVENGFVVQKRIHGYKELKDGDRDYFEDSKSYITTENPFEGDGDETIKLPDVKGLLDTSRSLEGKVKVG